MPAKKKDGAVKKKKEKKTEPDLFKSCYENFDQQEIMLLERVQTKTDFVLVDLKLIDWRYSHFSVLMRTSSKLSSVQRKIEEKHGR
jgi:hypothetical protein